jgi:hypothetical protein
MVTNKPGYCWVDACSRLQIPSAIRLCYSRVLDKTMSSGLQDERIYIYRSLGGCCIVEMSSHFSRGANEVDNVSTKPTTPVSIASAICIQYLAMSFLNGRTRVDTSHQPMFLASRDKSLGRSSCLTLIRATDAAQPACESSNG